MRAPGFMITMECNTPDRMGPNPEFANRACAEPQRPNLIIMTRGVYGNAIRFLVPLTSEYDVLAEALDINETSIDVAKGE